MRPAAWLLALAALLPAASLAQDDEAPVHPAQDAGIPEVEAEPARGVASWYGLPFHGRRTASGERFDMNAFTAAHPSLPFGTRVRVRSLVNGKVVTVRINDRGPHTGGRIIDLSHAAAKALGLLARGTKRVELQPVVGGP